MPLLKPALGAILLTLVTLVQAAPPPALEALFQTPAIGTMAISPDGSLLAATLPGRDGQLELAVADLDKTPLQFKTLGWIKDYDVWRVRWLNDKRLIFTARERQTGLLGHEVGLWAVDPREGDARVLIDPHWQGHRDNRPLSQRNLSADWEFYGAPEDGSDDVLAAWGDVDPLVPIGQGRDFRAAAKAAGVELEYVEYAGESHAWLKPETGIDFFGRAEKLLARALAD